MRPDRIPPPTVAFAVRDLRHAGFFLGRPRGLPPILILAGGAGCGFACGFAFVVGFFISVFLVAAISALPNGESRRSTVIGILSSSPSWTQVERTLRTQANTACSSRSRTCRSACVERHGADAQARVSGPCRA